MEQEEINKMLIDGARGGSDSTVIEALGLGADKAGKDAALSEAAAYGYTQTVALLLDNGADIHADHDRALQRATFNNYRETASMLLRYDADFHVEGDKILHLVAENSYKNMMLLLLRHGADPKAVKAYNDFDPEGWASQLKMEASKYFKSGPILREECFIDDKSRKPQLQDRVLDVCLSNQFVIRIAAPLIASKNKASRQLFQDIWDALPKHWQDQNQNIYVQFVAEGGVNHNIDFHTIAVQRDTGTSGRTVGM